MAVPLTTFPYAVITCEIKLFHNYFSLRRRQSEIILPEIISELFQRLIAAREYFPECSIVAEIIFEIVSATEMTLR